MRRIAIVALLLASVLAVHGQENYTGKGIGRAECRRRDFTQVRDPVTAGRTARGADGGGGKPRGAAPEFRRQLTTGTPDVCRLSTRDGARLPCCSISARSCAAGSRSRRRYAPTSGLLKVAMPPGRIGERGDERRRRRRPDGQRHERAFAARFYARRAVAGQCRGRELGVPLRADRPGGARCGAQSESRAGDPPLPRRPLSGVVPLR